MLNFKKINGIMSSRVAPLTFLANSVQADMANTSAANSIRVQMKLMNRTGMFQQSSAANTVAAPMKTVATKRRMSQDLKADWDFGT